MKIKCVLKSFLFLIIVIFTGCSNSSDATEREIGSEILQDEDSMEEITEHEKNIRKFITAVEENDADALFDLIEIRHDEDVYWTVKEAGDLIEYLSQSEAAMRDQLRSLGLSNESLTDPYNPSEMPDEFNVLGPVGFVILYPDGKMGVRVYEHEFNTRTGEIGYPEKVILTYNDEKEITLEQEGDSLDNKIGYFGPGKYEVHGEGFYKEGEVRENVAEMEIWGTDVAAVDNVDFKKTLTINLK